MLLPNWGQCCSLWSHTRCTYLSLRRSLLCRTCPYGLYGTLCAVLRRQACLHKKICMKLVTSTQDRSLPASESQGFLMMHEAARHAIHSSETLSVTVETVEAMQSHVVYLTSQSKQKSGNESETPSHVRTHMAFQASMLRNLLLRSQSNKKRLQNEIALVRQFV
jgi:hypothetical protein